MKMQVISATWMRMLACCCVLIGSAWAAQPRIVMVVSEDLKAGVQAEINTWSADLVAEGYIPIVKSWPKSLIAPDNDRQNVAAKALWDYLVSLRNEAGGLQGAVLVGKVPAVYINWYNYAYYYVDDKSFMDLTRWITLLPDANSQMNIWVSRVFPYRDVRYTPRDEGSDVFLTKRYLHENHLQRSGLRRLPHTAYYLSTPEFDNGAYDPSNQGRPLSVIYSAIMLKCFPKYIYKESDSLAVFNAGGEEVAETSHGTTEIANQVFGETDTFSRPAQIRHMDMSSCGGEIGGMATSMIFGRHSAITTASFPIPLIENNDSYILALKNGKSYGDAYKESGLKPSAWFTGDYSLRAMMAPANQMPAIVSTTQSTTLLPAGGGSVNFTVNATDPDGQIALIECYPLGWFNGKVEPISTNSGNILSYNYDRPHNYVPRVLAFDNYGAIAWKDLAKVVVAPNSDQPLRIACGYPNYYARLAMTPETMDYIDTQGKIWLGDQDFATGSWGFSGNSDELFSGATDVANTNDDQMYRTARAAGRNRISQYRATLRNGDYTVKLRFADMWSGAAGQRITDVAIEGVMVLSGFDAFAVAGPKTLVERSFNVMVQDGELTISLSCNPGASIEGFINAIEILPSVPAGAPAITQPATASPRVIALP